MKVLWKLFMAFKNTNIVHFTSSQAYSEAFWSISTLRRESEDRAQIGEGCVPDCWWGGNRSFCFFNWLLCMNSSIIMLCSLHNLLDMRRAVARTSTDRCIQCSTQVSLSGRHRGPVQTRNQKLFVFCPFNICLSLHGQTADSACHSSSYVATRKETSQCTPRAQAISLVFIHLLNVF